MDGLKVISGRDIIPQNGHNGSLVVDHREEIIFKWWLKWLLLFTKSGMYSSLRLKYWRNENTGGRNSIKNPLRPSFHKIQKVIMDLYLLPLKRDINGKKGQEWIGAVRKMTFSLTRTSIVGCNKEYFRECIGIAWILAMVTSIFVKDLFIAVKKPLSCNFTQMAGNFFPPPV